MGSAKTVLTPSAGANINEHRNAFFTFMPIDFCDKSLNMV